MTLNKFLFIAFECLSTLVSSQSKRIKILSADNTYVSEEYPGATVSIGNVFIEHEGATLRCDKAYIYQQQKLVKALGNVLINQGDTVFQRSKYTDYDGMAQLITSWGDVVMNDQFMTLKSDTVYFDRARQLLYYNYGGTIKDTTNLLVSEKR